MVWFLSSTGNIEMHFFYGNIGKGWWVHKDGKKDAAQWLIFEIDEIQDPRNDRIVWQQTHDSGDFYWPHFKEKNGTLTELEYYDDSKE
jgi:hypothetical protein